MKMVTQIIIDSDDTEKDSNIIDNRLYETPVDLPLPDNSTIQAVRNCHNALDSSNNCRKIIMRSLDTLSKDIQTLGVTFKTLDEEISDQWRRKPDEL